MTLRTGQIVAKATRSLGELDHLEMATGYADKDNIDTKQACLPVRVS